MDDSKAGPSGIKKRKVAQKVQKTMRDRYPLSDEQLSAYLMDSDDDVNDPDYLESDSNYSESDQGDSDFEQEVDVSTRNDDLDIGNSDFLQAPTSPSPSRQTPGTQPPQTPGTPPPQTPPAETPPLPVIWNSVEDVPRVIPFSKHRELLIHPEGDFFSLPISYGLQKKLFFF